MSAPYVSTAAAGCNVGSPPKPRLRSRVLWKRTEAQPAAVTGLSGRRGGDPDGTHGAGAASPRDVRWHEGTASEPTQASGLADHGGGDVGGASAVLLRQVPAFWRQPPSPARRAHAPGLDSSLMNSFGTQAKVSFVQKY